MTGTEPKKSNLGISGVEKIKNLGSVNTMEVSKEEQQTKKTRISGHRNERRTKRGMIPHTPKEERVAEY